MGETRTLKISVLSGKCLPIAITTALPRQITWSPLSDLRRPLSFTKAACRYLHLTGTVYQINHKKSTHLVWVAGFEPAMSRLRSERSNRTLLHPDILDGPVKLILDHGAPRAYEGAGSLWSGLRELHP